MIAGVIPEIRYGVEFAGAWRPTLPPDSARYWSAPRMGSERTRTLSGVEDGWVVGMDHYVTGQFRFEARASWWGNGPPAWWAWAQAGNVVRLYPTPLECPDWYVSVYLVEDAPDVGLEPNAGMSASWAVTFRGASGGRVSPAWVVLSPDTAASEVTFTRTGTATYVEHT